MHVKICGLKHVDMIDVAIDAGADHVGFVHFARSPRHLELDSIRRLGRHAGKRAMRWVVLASPSDETLRACAALHGDIDGLQIHGRSNDALINEISAGPSSLEIMRAYSVASREDVEGADLQCQASHLLFDARPRPDDKLPGGNGASFDWQIMDALDMAALAGRPWFLAGGLNAGNVADAIAQSGAGAVDVSSGVEREPGVKDAALIAQFVRAAKSL